MMLRTLINSSRDEPNVFLGRCMGLLTDLRSLVQPNQDNSPDLDKIRENIGHYFDGCEKICI